MNLDVIAAGGGGWGLTDRSPDPLSMAPTGCPGSLPLPLGLLALRGLAGIATLARLARAPSGTGRDAAGAGAGGGPDAEESAF